VTQGTEAHVAKTTLELGLADSASVEWIEVSEALFDAYTTDEYVVT